jgi:hypothetical protein
MASWIDQPAGAAHLEPQPQRAALDRAEECVDLVKL